jgi:hypothetical protein
VSFVVDFRAPGAVTAPGDFFPDKEGNMIRTIVTVGVVILVGLAAGCGSSSNTAGNVEQGNRTALEELGQTLKSLAAEGRKPPAGLPQLEPLEPLMAVAGPAIRSGAVIYVWGAGYDAAGTQIIAYEKKAPTDGGLVLLQDGTVKEMKAAEFQAAPKATK